MLFASTQSILESIKSVKKNSVTKQEEKQKTFKYELNVIFEAGKPQGLRKVTASEGIFF